MQYFGCAVAHVVVALLLVRVQSVKDSDNYKRQATESLKTSLGCTSFMCICSVGVRALCTRMLDVCAVSI
jgi:hypothetical protein